MQPTERFTSRTAYYHEHRPGYPDAVAELLITQAGLASDAVVVDVGAGTGLSSELFLRNGCAVVAIEPNAAMRSDAEARLSANPLFLSREGKAEAIPLPDASADLIVAATAFHWFDAKAARREWARVLKPEGWAALIWNRRWAEKSEFTRAYDQALRNHSPEYTADWSRKKENFGPMAASFFAPCPVHETHFEQEQWLDFEGLVGRILSASYAPLPGSPGYGPMIADLEEAFTAHACDGRVALLYDVCVYSGRLAC
jgi:ubiquinone/menaquinone biosynthesis C-methylase UbiE